MSDSINKFKKISLILPAFNVQNIIGNAVKLAEKEIKKVNPQEYEIIVVDDGSFDSTWNELKELKNIYGDRLRIIHLSKNSGKGNAIKKGISLSQGDIVGFIDSDLDIVPENIPIFLNYFKENRADILIGSKRHPESKINYPKRRLFLSNLFNLVVKIIFRINLSDTQTGIKFFKKDLADSILRKTKCKRYIFDLEFLLIALKNEWRIVEYPVIIEYRKKQKRINLFEIFNAIIEIGKVFFYLKLKKYDKLF
ncbi:MAG: glycosyltransferase family 2 protein [Acidobacteriota bacterium]